MTRILFVTDSIREPWTGVGRTAAVLLRELHRHGAEIKALDWQPNGFAADLGIETLVIPIGGPLRTGRWHLRLLRRVARRARPEDEVLFDPTGYPDAFGRHPRCALMVHDLSMLQPGVYRPGKRMWFRAFLGRSLAKAARLVCVSEYTRGQLLASYPGLDPERCVVVHNCLDPDLPVAAEAEPAEPPYFLAIGAWERRKNLVRLIDAIDQVRRTGLDVRLTLAGRPGHGYDEIAQRADAPDLNGAVTFVRSPSDEELAQLRRSAAALAFPSLEEGFGLPILEAMRAGLPVLTSDRTATAEVAGDAALLVDPTDTRAMGDALARLATDGVLRRDLVVRGRQRVEQFSAARSGELLLDVLRGLAGDSGG